MSLNRREDRGGPLLAMTIRLHKGERALGRDGSKRSTEPMWGMSRLRHRTSATPGDYMPRCSINQSVNVHSVPPAAAQISGVNEGEEHVHAFENLIPACEFAVSIASEGHSDVSLRTELEGDLDLAEAQQIVRLWHSGQVPLNAEEIEY
jgi:hypothetical protein